MLLVIDVGNTQTVVGLYSDGDNGVADNGVADDAVDGGDKLVPESNLLDHWRISSNPERTADEYALMVQEFLGFHGFSFDEDVDGVAVSSVVPRVASALREMVVRYMGFRPVVVEPGTKTGMPILYDNPKEVGADRIVNAVAAYDLYGGPTIVVDFGTATTFDAISAKGEYLGGSIVPGVEISLDALYSRAAALRRVELIEPRNVVGKTTAESIQSGTIYGLVAQVDGLCDRIDDEIGDSNVVATGGLAGLVTPLSRRIQHHEPWLTLHGLRLIFAKNES